jgi:hypothetical protein
MALPQLSNNTPSAGYISWTAFGVQVNGVGYDMPADSTNKKFVWWAYNNGAPTMVKSDTLPDSLALEDYFLFLNKTGIGMHVDSAQVVDGSIIVNESIYASAIAADQINAGHIQTDAITADHIGAGVIEAEHIGAGQITAEKLSVGTVSDNSVVNGSFEDALTGTLVGWEVSAMQNGTITPVTGVASSGAVSIQFDATTTTANLRLRQKPAQFIPVSAASGRKMYVSARLGVSVATTVGNYIRVNWYDGNKVLLASGNYADIRGNAALTTTFTVYEGQVTPPATAKYMGIEILLVNPNVVTKMYLDEVTVHEVTMSVQIGDGQVTAAKILAGTITADRLAASTITSDKILVTDQTNYWENPDFEGDTVGQRARGTSSGNSRVIASGAGGSGKSMEIDALNGSNDDVYGLNQFPVQPGDRYVVRCDYKFLNTAGTGVAGIGFQTFNATKGNVTWTRVVSTDNPSLVAANTARPTAWKDSGFFIYTVPAGTYFLKPWVTFGNNGETTNRFHIDNIVIRRMNGGELIVDGAITAAKIETDAVTADKIMANAVTAGKILAGEIGTAHMTAGTINADRLVAGSITATQIDTDAITADKIEGTAINGMTITGATVQTAATGARVVMDETGLKAWDAANINYLTADSTGLTMEALVKVKGFTEYGTSSEGMTAYLGNLPYGSSKNPDGSYFEYASGLHWKVDADDPEDEHARVVSEQGKDVYIGSGKHTLYAGGSEGHIHVGQRDIDIRTTSHATYRGLIRIRTGTSTRVTAADSSVGVNEIRIGGLPGAAEETIVLESPETHVTGSLYAGYQIDVSPWQPMALVGSWANYSGGGGYIGGIRCRRVGTMLVVQGMVKSGSGQISTLPTGYMPQFSVIRPVIAAGAAASIAISNTGQITYLSGPVAPSYVAINEIIPL